jgi:hypothetical protein
MNDLLRMFGEFIHEFTDDLTKEEFKIDEIKTEFS